MIDGDDLDSCNMMTGDNGDATLDEEEVVRRVADGSFQKPD